MPDNLSGAASDSNSTSSEPGAAPFVYVVFHGDRFDGGVIPVEVLSELATYREAVVAAAKGLFRVQNKGRRRVPKGYEASIRLVLKGSVIPGSAIATIERVRLAEPVGAQTALPVPDEVDQAVDYVEQWMKAVVDDLQLPDSLEPNDLKSVERALGGLGRHLLPGEEVETRTGARKVGVRYGSDARRKLAERSGRRDLEVDYENVAGLVTAVTAGSGDQTFTLDLGDLGTFSSLTFDPDKHDPLQIAAPDGHPIPVFVSFTAIEDPRSLGPRTIKEVVSLAIDDGATSQFVVPDETSFEQAISEFREMHDGWLDGIGRAPVETAIGWASTVIPEVCREIDLPLPWIYPTQEGGVRGEWEVGSWRASLSYDPKDDVLSLFAADLDADGYTEADLAVGDATADRIVAFFRDAMP